MMIRVRDQNQRKKHLEDTEGTSGPIAAAKVEGDHRRSERMQRKAGHSQHQRYQGRNPEPPELFFEDLSVFVDLIHPVFPSSP